MPRTTTVVEDPWTKNLKFDYRRKDETGKSEDPKYHGNLEEIQVRHVRLPINMYHYRRRDRENLYR